MSIYDGLDDLLDRVLESIRPKKQEYLFIERVYSRIKNVLEEVLREHGVEAEVSLQGSTAKDTWLSGEYDLDVFVLFPSSWSRRDIDEKGFKLLVEAGKRIGEYSVRYAEHPYVRVFVEGVEADIVPAIKIESASRAKTAVDRTPFHTRYIIENLTREQRDHVRLLKKFMKTIGVYGAEVKVRGFSGYMVELLILAYKDFIGVLENASRWKIPVYVNTLGVDKKEFREVIRVLKKRYPDSILYAPDPVDPYRNAGAAVSRRSLAIFSIAAKCFLKNPSIDFFFTRRPSREDYREAFREASERCIVLLILPVLYNIPPEALWGELGRIADRLEKIARVFDFKPIYHSIWSDEERLAVIGVEFECTLSKYKCREGPPYDAGLRVDSFIEKHYRDSPSGPWVDENGFLKAVVYRRYRFVEEMLRDRAREYLVAPHFRSIEPVILYGGAVDSIRDNSGGLMEWFVDFVLRKPVWMRNCIV